LQFYSFRHAEIAGAMALLYFLSINTAGVTRCYGGCWLSYNKTTVLRCNIPLL